MNHYLREELQDKGIHEKMQRKNWLAYNTVYGMNYQ